MPKPVSTFLTLICSLLLINQAVTAQPEKITVPQRVVPLPGGLDQTPVFNSNSPEVVQSEGILLSTFPPEAMANANAHLNLPLDGRFDVFFHHIANGIKANDRRTLYIAFVLKNPGDRKVTVRTIAGCSYLSQPDAPFVPLPPVKENRHGKLYSGPGDRVTLDLLRGHKQSGWPLRLTLKPGEEKIVFVRPIPVKKLDQPLNGRSGLLKLSSDGQVYAALLAAFATQEGGAQTKPAKEKWHQLLHEGQLCGPRDITPSVAGAPGPYKYGRVAGVSKGAIWRTDSENGPPGADLSLANGETISYPISSVHGGTFGTGQIQSAPIVVRYPDSAYEAHGNYGVKYDLNFPVANKTDSEQMLSLTMQTPIKQDDTSAALQFQDPPPERVFFRGSIKLEYDNDEGKQKNTIVHLTQRQAELMPALLQLRLRPGERRVIHLTLYYPPDSTPPQVVTFFAAAAN